MSIAIPLHYIEQITEHDTPEIRISGTRFRVADVVLMHIKQGSSIDWIADNYDALNHAQIHAALAYYYAHVDEIEAEIRAMLAADVMLEQKATSLNDLRAKIESRNKQ